MKKNLPFCFSLITLVLTLSVSSINAQYTLTDDDVVVTDGVIESCSYDFSVTDIVIPGTLDGQTVVGIRDGNSHTDGVFYNKGITSLVLPSTLSDIGDFAFYTNAIINVDLSACTSLTRIGGLAFHSNSITSLDLSACSILATIEGYAFCNNNINSLNISSCTALITIGARAFGPNSLTSLDLSGCTALTNIGRYAFSENLISSIDFGGCTALVDIEDGAFDDNSLTTIDLSLCTALNNIGRSAFASNTGLSAFTLPNRNHSDFQNWIDGYGNNYAAGETVSNFETNYHAVIPYTLTDDDVVVTDGVIQSCSYDFTLTDIIIPATLDAQSVIGIKNGNWGSGVFEDKGITTLQLPATLTNIGDYAFHTNYDLITIDFSLCSALANIGSYAFGRNYILTNLNLSGCSSLTNIEDYAFFQAYYLSSVDLSLCTELSNIGEYAFNFNSLSSLDLSPCTALTKIGNNAFSKGSLTSLNLSSCTELVYIGDNAFEGNSLSSLDLSECTGLTYIGSSAFHSNSALGSFTLPTPNYTGFLHWVDGNDNTFAPGASVNDFATYYLAMIPYTLTDDDVVVNDGIIESCSYDFTLLNIIIPETLDGQTVTGIRDGDSETEGVFYNKSITSIVFPTSIKNIGDYAFSSNSIQILDLSNCTALSTIGDYAFDNNTGLSSLTLPTPNHPDFEYWFDANGNTYTAGAIVNDFQTSYHAKIPYTLTDYDVVVVDGVIESCSYDFSLTDIIMPGTLDGQTVTGIKNETYHENGVFYNKGITSLELPSTLTLIGGYAFRSNSITSLDLSNCVALTNIEYGAFEKNFITNIDLSNCHDLKFINNYAFMDNLITGLDLSTCTSLELIGELAFYHNSIFSLNLNGCSSLINIDTWAFQANSISSLDLNGCTTLSRIGFGAFTYNALSSLDLSACVSLTYIGGMAFSYNYLTEFTLPTPNITGGQFNYWIDGDDIQYDGGAIVNNFGTSYTANLAGSLTVTFTVTDGTNPIVGAVVEFGSYGTSTTNSSGIATFTNVAPGNYIVYTVSATNYNNLTGKLSFTEDVNEDIDLTVITGFEDLFGSKIKIYPNPATNYITISQPINNFIVNVDIFSMQGQKVKSQTIVNEHEAIQLNIQELKNGAYILELHMKDNFSCSKRILKK